MAAGPGIYDDLCTYVREETKARGVIVIIIKGDKGSGMSCQVDGLTALMLPEVLRKVIADIEEGER